MKGTAIRFADCQGDGQTSQHRAHPEFADGFMGGDLLKSFAPWSLLLSIVDIMCFACCSVGASF